MGTHTPQSKEVRHAYTNTLSGKAHDVMDCLMTNICSDRTLPPILNDFDGEEMGDSFFSHLMNYETWKKHFVFDYNHAAYSKTMSGPLWADILERMNQTQNRFVLYSAHDTTIMTVLATLGNNIATSFAWPPYASMLLFEVYSKDSNLSFRIVYNGNIITHIVEGCEEELCELQTLFHIVGEFSTEEQQCSLDEFTS